MVRVPVSYKYAPTAPNPTTTSAAATIFGVMFLFSSGRGGSRHSFSMVRILALLLQLNAHAFLPVAHRTKVILGRNWANFRPRFHVIRVRIVRDARYSARISSPSSSF